MIKCLQGGTLGRSAHFDREDLLDQAMQIFCDNGYRGTPVARLLEQIGLNPGSLYVAFGSKKRLFEAVLDRYAAKTLTLMAGEISRSTGPLAGIRSLFMRLADDADGSGNRENCLLIKTALEVGRHDSDLQERLNAYFASIETLLCETLERARSMGELPQSRDPKSLASFLFSGVLSLRVLGTTAILPGHARTIAEHYLHLFH